MFGRKFLLVVLLTGLTQLSQAADRKASVRQVSSGAAIVSPVVGYFWSDTDGLASIDGVPGAAHVGRPLPAADRVVLPPGQAYAWLEGSDGVSFLDLDGLRTVAGNGAADAGSDGLAFSPNGSAAVAYFRSAGQIQIVSGLPNSPQRVASFAAPQADCGAVAVTDDATTVLLTCGTNLYRAGADRVWQPAMPGQAVAVSFLPGATDALVVMTGDPAVYGISLDAQNAGVRAQLPSGMNDPVSLAVSADGRFGIAIDGDGNAAQLDLFTSQTAQFRVPQGMQTVQRGRDASTFLLISDGGGVPWIVEARAGSPSVSFAPRIPQAPAVSQQ